MRSIVQMILAACAMAIVSSPILAAETSAPAAPPVMPAAGGTPDAIPFDIPYGVSIGLERAKQVMAAAEAEAKRRNWKLNIAVVDTNGELVHFSRMEGAMIASVSISTARPVPRRAFVGNPVCSTTSLKAATPISARSIQRSWQVPAAFRWLKTAS